MALEVREDQHRIVVDDVPAHRNFLKVLAAFNGQIHRALSVHDVNRAEGPAVGPQGFTMPFRGLPRTGIQNIRQQLL